MARDSDVTWEHYGRENPYFGVLSDPKFVGQDLDEETKLEFFTSGEEHVRHVLETIRRTVCSNFDPNSALDFGCGAGRLVIPFARSCSRVVGVDVSDGMLREAAMNASSMGADGVEFVKSDDELSRVTGSFDLVHSYIVLQHIPTKRGYQILDRLMGLISPGGVGALHVTFDSRITRAAQAKHLARLHVPGLHGAINVAKGRRFDAFPVMQMNHYNLNRVMAQAVSLGCPAAHIEFTDHGSRLGAMIFFKRPA